MDSANDRGEAAPGRALPRSGRTEAVVDVPAGALWTVVSDVTRVGEWSHECRTVRWLGRANAAVPGARFRGRNRSGLLRWARVCEVVAVDPGRELRWRTVPSGLFPDVTEWRVTLEPVGERTRIVQSFQVITIARWLAWLIARVNTAHLDRSDALAGDLHRLAAVAAPSVAALSVAAPSVAAPSVAAPSGPMPTAAGRTRRGAPVGTAASPPHRAP